MCCLVTSSLGDKLLPFSFHSTILLHARFLCRKQARSCLVSRAGQSEIGGPYDANARHLPLTDTRCWCSLPSAVRSVEWVCKRDDKESCKVLNFWIGKRFNDLAWPNPFYWTILHWWEIFLFFNFKRYSHLFTLKQNCLLRKWLIFIDKKALCESEHSFFVNEQALWALEIIRICRLYVTACSTWCVCVGRCPWDWKEGIGSWCGLFPHSK